MQYSVARFVTHRDTGRFQLFEHCFVTGVGGIRTRVNEDSHRHTRFELVYELGRVRRILHEPERDIDADGFCVDEVP
jgi:hypothetical protein